MAGILSGVKVLDLTRVLAGPYCGMMLADMGADVIKIELPGRGDDSRGNAPTVNGESAYFMNLNRNKYGMTLNLKSEEGKKIFTELLKTADVVCENYKVGVLERLGFSYEVMKEINPRIIYGSISGHGLTGDLATRPAYDIVAQAMSGMMSVTGFQDGPPCKIGPSIADNYSGAYLCMGILMALYEREQTGVGRRIDVAMVDTLFSVMENFVVEYTIAGKTPHRAGNQDPSIAPFDIFKCKDGFVALGVGNDKLFQTFCRTIGHEELLEDPRYTTNDLRCNNYVPDLQNVIIDWCKDYTKSEVEAIMDEAGIPCGPVLNVKEAIEHPHIQARDMMVHCEHPTAGDQYFQGCVMKLSETPGSVDFPSPLLGQHNAEIFGLTEEEVAQLKEEGVL